MDLVFAPSEIETWPIDRLRPYAHNAKIHGDDQVAKIAASMAKFGWTVPCMVADDGELIAGHGRILTATMLGLGRRVAYHFLRRHPGDSTDPGLAGDIVRVPASEVIHVIDPVEGGQLRGVSKLAPAIVKLFLLDQYDDAELDRKKVAAM